jgi:hypothetical protein
MLIVIRGKLIWEDNFWKTHLLKIKARVQVIWIIELWLLSFFEWDHPCGPLKGAIIKARVRSFGLLNSGFYCYCVGSPLWFSRGQ